MNTSTKIISLELVFKFLLIFNKYLKYLYFLPNIGFSLIYFPVPAKVYQIVLAVSYFLPLSVSYLFLSLVKLFQSTTI